MVLPDEAALRDRDRFFALTKGPPGSTGNDETGFKAFGGRPPG